MTFDKIILQKHPTAKEQGSLSELFLAEANTRPFSNSSRLELKDPVLLAGENQKIECAARAEKPDAEERRKHERIQSAFGQDVLDNLTNRSWLNANVEKLKTGFKRIHDGRGEEFTVGQIAAHLNELSGGLIYSKLSEGSKSPFSTTPPDGHFHVYLKGMFVDTELIHQTTRNVGPGYDRTTRST